MADRNDEVLQNSHVEIDLIDKKGTRERLVVDLVPNEAADFSAGRLGVGTPLAQAIIGKRQGDVISYRKGDLIEARIVRVSPGKQIASGDAAAERDEKLRQAVSQAELGNMISFALTFDSKWGDYDPEQIAAHWDEEHKASSDSAEKPDEGEK